MHKRFASVVLECSISKALDYSIPEPLFEIVSKGSLVQVPLRGKTQRGFVVAVKETAEVARTLPIQKCIHQSPLNDELFSLALFMAKYYMTPLGKVIRTMLPSGVRKSTNAKTQHYVVREKTKEEIRQEIVRLLGKAPQQVKALEGLLQVRKGILLTKLLEQTKSTASSVKALAERGIISLKKVDPDEDLLEDEEYLLTKPKKLRHDQKSALEAIQKTITSGAFHTHLLFGITGSGKTEVYLQAIAHALEHNKGVIMLVPEISLTQQTIDRFKSRFQEKIAILHHRISDGKRKETWEEIQQGKCPIVIGARSAIFAPIPRLGLIIVDEEHETSYKQTDETPSYNARDLAVVRAKMNQATVVLGSATPSLESYYNAVQGKYSLSKLAERHEGAKLPDVLIVDMKHEYEKAKGATLFSDPLLHEIKGCIERGEQAILFLNRRGYHTSLQCLGCGKTVSCSHCETALTFHKKEHRLACHLCGFEAPPPRSCPSCRSEAMLKFSGVGTEKVEAALKAVLKDVRVLRIDRDSTRHKGSLEILVNDFRTGKADVLIGTQMIAKGLHFPEVTLVGVLNCDTQLNLPDFRAQETIFQLITQVAGRAGRGEAPGKVILQTKVPEHDTLRLAKNQDYEGFYKEEIAIRKHFFFPPFSRIVKVTFTAPTEERARTMADQYHGELEKRLHEGIILHPVTSAGHPKVKDQYRFHILVRGPSTPEIISLLEAAEASLEKLPQRFIDVDPISTFF